MTPHRLAGVFGIALAACGRPEELPFYRTREMSPEWLTARQASLASMHRVAPFRMVDQHGADVSERTLEGKATIVHFFFTTCGDICPTTTSNIRRLLERVPDEARLQVLSVSVAPELDSVPELRRFAARHQIADPRWHLLTGARAATEQLARESFFTTLGSRQRNGVASVAHTESVWLVDASGRLRGVYAGMLLLEMSRLEEDLRVLIASQ